MAKDNTSESNNPKDWYTVKQAAEYLGVSEPTIFRWMKDGSLSFYKVGSSTRFSQETLDNVIQKNTSTREAQQVVTKCTACGHNVLVEGKMQGSGRLYFRPGKSGFWVLHEAMVPTNARVCCACGNIQFYADVEKLKKLKPAKVQVP